MMCMGIMKERHYPLLPYHALCKYVNRCVMSLSGNTCLRWHSKIHTRCGHQTEKSPNRSCGSRSAATVALAKQSVGSLMRYRTRKAA